MVKAPWVQKTKLQNTSTTLSHEPTRPPTHEVVDTPTYRSTHLPIHPPTMYYSSTAVCTAASSTCVGIYLRFILCRAGVFIFYDSPPPRERATRPREGASPHPPLAESVIGAHSFAMAQRAAVWGGCGATAKPREAEWSSGVAAVFWVLL